jgi:heat-inducible transcriptional repressor
MTPRQFEILSKIVQHYAETAEPVGSLALVEYFELSPATIRAEMVALEQAGYIYQPHISAGRVPTDAGYRLYVNNLSNQSQSTHELTSTRSAQTISKRVESLKDRTDAAIKIAAETLSDLTGNTAFATLSDTVYFHGLHQLFSQPEFIDQLRAAQAARFLDQMGEWLFGSFDHGFAKELGIFIGAENPFLRTSGMTMVVSRFESPYSDSSYIGIVGPTRQNYEKVTSLVRLTGEKLEEALA